MSRPRTPLFGTVNVTTMCNLDCTYCFMQPMAGEYMSASDFARALSELEQSKIFFLNISGGEPFLHPAIGDFLKLAHQKFHHVMTLTNGTCLSSKHIETIDEIIEVHNRFNVQVSLDSIDPIVNSRTRTKSSQAFSNIRKLSSLGANVIVATVVTRHNIDSICRTIEELAGYAKYFHLMTVQDVRLVDGIEADLGVSQLEQDELWREVESLGESLDVRVNTPLNYDGERGCASGAPCMAGFSHIVIDPSLAVRPCDRLVDVVVGSLKNSSLEEIWNSTELHPVLQSELPYCRTH